MASIQLHTLSNAPGARHRRKRLGRGESSGHGKTSGKGNKGQMARSGHKRKAGFEGGQMRLIRKMPKRGFVSSDKVAYIPVNVAALQAFEDGAEVTAAALRAHGLARGGDRPIKLLGDGELSRKLTVKVHAFSASARAKIEAAGGACEVVH